MRERGPQGRRATCGLGRVGGIWRGERLLEPLQESCFLFLPRGLGILPQILEGVHRGCACDGYTARAAPHSGFHGGCKTAPDGRTKIVDEAATKRNGNLAKPFIWDDPLLGLFSSHFERRPMRPHYARVSAQLNAQARGAAPRNRVLFQYASLLSACLALKADLRTRARSAYLAGDRRGLQAIAADTKRTIIAMQRLWRAHRAIWLQENKPFGLEVLDLRYGGQLSRLRILQERLRAHLAGRAPKIDEFDVKPQNFLGEYPYHGRKYRGTASPVFSIWV